MTPDRGVFVTFEGGDGSGKTTQLRRLAVHLRKAGREVLETREPGGAPGAEEIRRLVLEGAPGRWSPVSELLLFNAARRDHLEHTIRPALARGAVVLCDRFADSTRVYQSAGRADGTPGADPALVEDLHRLVIGMEPDLTLILDIDPTLGLTRGFARGGTETRFESLGADFQTRIREGFRAIAAKHPHRCRLIDASGDMDTVATRVRAAAADLISHTPEAPPESPAHGD